MRPDAYPADPISKVGRLRLCRRGLAYARPRPAHRTRRAQDSSPHSKQEDNSIDHHESGAKPDNISKEKTDVKCELNTSDTKESDGVLSGTDTVDSGHEELD